MKGKTGEGKKQRGRASIVFETPPVITAAASTVGKKEGDGPLGTCFDRVELDPMLGKKTWEEAESELQSRTAGLVIEKSGLSREEIRYSFAGDLLAQLIATSFGNVNLEIPMFGLYGACSTMGEGLGLGAMCVEGGFADHVLVSASSHFASAEKQFRFPLEYGNQRLEPGMNVVEIARMLKLGMQTPVRVTLNYARTRAFLASRLARQLDADSAELMRALTDPQLAREVGTDSLQLFSIFIPNTYEFYWTVSPEDFVRRMRKEYDRFWTPERDAARRRSGLSRDEVMTLASIVTEETNKADEMPRVAGVYINRLRKGMPLQADPTVKYALQDFSLRRILHKHLRTPSPYNTYLNKGLPPSSIAMPSVAAIDGVLNFENHDYLFFCARPTFDGYHSFARTYGEHLANARAYSAELNRRNIK